MIGWAPTALAVAMKLLKPVFGAPKPPAAAVWVCQLKISEDEPPGERMAVTPAAFSSGGMAASFMSLSYTAVFTPIPCAGTEPRPAVAFTVTDAVRGAAWAGTATEAIPIAPSPSSDEKNRTRLCIAASDNVRFDGAAHGRFRRLNRSTSRSRDACRTAAAADVAMKFS